MHIKKNRQFWIVAIIGFLIDQITKYIVTQTFNLGESRPIISNVFHLTYVRNTGAAFSLFTGQVGLLRWLSLAVSLGLISFGLFYAGFNKWEKLGYGFILSGALGNGIDRFLLGYVVDFLDFPLIKFPIFSFVDFQFRLINFPVFNLADLFINVGIACLLISTFRRPSSSPRRPADPPRH